jgi:palmitoyltransferase ZDHHC9/14/18/palmitoyltransferase
MARLYQIWPGLNQFPCCGLLVGGPAADRLPLLTGWGGLVAAGLVYAVCCAPYQWIAISPVCPILVGLTWLVTVYTYARACFSDPGLLPRGEILSRLLDADAYEVNRVAVTHAPLSIYEHNNLCEGVGSVSFCATCGIHRPRLSTHCRQCDSCVMGWDHHCNWIGTCVGQRNHRHFVQFLVNVPLFCLLVCALATVQLCQTGIGGSSAQIGAIVLCVTMFFCGFGIMGVTLMHLTLVMEAQTMKMNSKLGPNQPALSSQQRWGHLWTFCMSYGPRPSLCLPRARIKRVSQVEPV